jgi:hypothetical protein
VEIDPSCVAAQEIAALWNAVGAALWPSRPAQPRREPISPLFLRAVDQQGSRPTAH